MSQPPPLPVVAEAASPPLDTHVREAPWTPREIAAQVAKGKRVAVICGAGVSCASGIPDFRSVDGLFEILKRRHPEAKLSSGKDLFDASLFRAEHTSRLYYTMVAELKAMCDRAEPTSFHRWLKQLNNAQRLFRVYTQNIDGLEARAGLPTGLGDRGLPVRRSKKRKQEPQVLPTPDTSMEDEEEIPKCIPLHGTLDTMTCTMCSHTERVDDHIDTLAEGSTIACPRCEELDSVREACGARSRGIGWLKPDIALYGEPHADAERIGAITSMDLTGPRPDIVLVAGTSLRIPGVKLLVRELSKVAKRATPARMAQTQPQSQRADEPKPNKRALGKTATWPLLPADAPVLPLSEVQIVFVNDAPPPSLREWRSVFDVWVKQDIQDFIGLVQEETASAAARKAALDARRLSRAASVPVSVPVSAPDSAPNAMRRSGSLRGVFPATKGAASAPPRAKIKEDPSERERQLESGVESAGESAVESEVVKKEV